MATFAKYRHSNIKGDKGTDWNIEIWKSGYSGSSTEFDMQGEGFKVTWNGSGGTRTNRFLGSDCSVSMFIKNNSDEDFAYDVLTSGFQSYYIRVYKGVVSNDNIWWFGWIQPSFDKLENTPFPYVYNLIATDSIGYFNKKKSLKFASEDEKNNSSSISSLFTFFLESTDYGLSLGGDNPTNLATEGNFPDPSPDWDIQPTWTIPSGGGQIDYDGTITKYIRQNLNSSVVAGSDYTISFTISNLADGESAQLSLKNYNGQHFFNSNTLTYTSNGNYQVSGTSLYNSSGFRITGHVGDSFSLTDVFITNSLVENRTPSPTNTEWLRMSSNWWRDGDSGDYGSINPLSKYSISSGAFAEETKYNDDGSLAVGGNPLEFKQQDVFNGMLKLFNLKGFLAEGKYNFIQPNLLATNANGDLLTYSYKGFGFGSTSENISTILTINQSENVILSGSTFIYEPPLESATIAYSQESSIFKVSEGTNFEGNEVVVGYTNYNTGRHTLEFKVINKINVLDSDFVLGDSKSVFSNTYRNSCSLSIKLSNGTDDYYLQEASDSNILIWTLSNAVVLSIDIQRGYFADNYNPVNNVNIMNIPGGISNSNDWDDSGWIPCSTNQDDNSTTHPYFNTYVFFTGESQSPPISGNVTIETNTSNTYYERNSSGAGNVNLVNTPTPTSNTTLVSSVTYTPTELNESENISSDVVYKASQTDTIAIDTQDLGHTPIGQRLTETATISQSADKLYSVQYTESGIKKPAVQGFRNGNSGEYRPILQLIVNEYLDLQSKPLEILQADIQSSDISPLKLLKYSLNQDSSFKNYAFLGGTFSAQSEIMSGEWYNVRDYSVGIVDDTPLMTGEFPLNPNINNNNNFKQDLKSIHKSNHNLFSENSIATVDTLIESSNSTTSIGVGSSLKSDIAENQKLKLTYPDGSNAITVTVTDAYNDSATSLSVSSFDSVIDYPIGSILSAAPYEAVSLMQRYVSSGNVNFRSSGVNNIQEMNFLPHDFNLTSNPSVGVGSNDLGGSIRIASATANMYAQKLISKGKTITKVNIFGSANFAFRVYVGFIFNDTTTLVGSGTANTELDITDIVGTSRNYITIQIDVGSASEKVYGGYALVTNT